VTDKNDAIVIGAGIAGLGVSALLHQVELGDAGAIQRDGGDIQGRALAGTGGDDNSFALNSAALSARICAEQILQRYKP
jgi:hypothetical protein